MKRTLATKDLAIHLWRRLKNIVSSRLYRNAFYLMLTTGVTSVLGFVFWIIIARFYSVVDVGYASAIISATSMLAFFSMAGLNVSLIRFLRRDNNPGELINVSLTSTAVISLVVAGIFVMGVGVWSPALNFIRENGFFVVTFIAVVTITTLSDMVGSVFVAERRAEFTFLKGIITSVLKMPLPIVLAAFFHAFSVVASWAIATLVALFVSLFHFLPRIETGYRLMPSFSISRIKGLWRYSIGSYTASLLTHATIAILPLMVLNLLGSERNAYFFIAWSIAAILFAIPRATSESLFAEGIYTRENMKENLTRAIRFNFILLIPAAAVLILGGKWILLAFGTRYSVNALHLLWLLSLSSLPRGVSDIYTTLLRAQDRLKELVLLRGLITAATLLLGWWAMETFGIIGLGFVILGVQLVAAGVLAIRLRTSMNLKTVGGADC